MNQPKDVETVTTDLREALARAGVVLPSLRPDPVSYEHRYLPPLVELGRCTMDVARRLTRALDGSPPELAEPASLPQVAVTERLSIATAHANARSRGERA
ncbi:hypothetical protein ACGFWI_10405 [Streptomyces sp. NPDC048434]|uniref:hypothetical protein n=1 Tax=Streptomyces sp. NPDC048434 TaxID=3365549 RepID=UPI00372483E1